MNKIIIVGHPYSGHEEVQCLLAECGMASAVPSRRDNLMPAQITQTLLKAHGAVPFEELQTVQQLQQIRVAPVWQGMVLDLMLANLDQALWGWADTDAVYLLDYWKEQDSQVVFVLVYDGPETVFTRAPLELAVASEEELQRRINAWVAYNSALLHFHLRNPGRSVLVHATQVQASVNSTLHHISAHIKAPLQLPCGLLATAASRTPQEMSVEADTVESLTAKLRTMQGSQFKKARKRLRAQLEVLQAAASSVAEGLVAVQHHGVTTPAMDLPLGPVPSAYSQDHLSNDALAKLLARQLLQAHPEATQLYEELQAAATLAHSIDVRLTNAVPALPSESSVATYQAWQALVKQRLHLQEQTRRAQTQAEQIKLMQQQVQEVGSDALEEQLQLQAQLQQTQESLEFHQQLTQQQKQAAEEENQLLQTQLYQVQEELERYDLEGKKHRQEIERLKKTESLAAERQKLVEQTATAKTELEKMLAAQKQQSDQLKKQLEQTQESLECHQQLTQQQKQAAEEENQLLQTQLYQVQEELERYDLEGKKHRQEIERLKKTESLAAERQKLVEQTATAKTELEKMLAAQKQQSDQLKKQLEEKMRAAVELGQKLQSTKKQKEADDEAQKENALLLSQLHQVQGELERYYLENQKLKAMQQPEPKAYYGAADRVKQQLSYRLGATMVTQSRSLGGWLTMPFALRAEVKRFRKDQAMCTAIKLPPITQYRDAHEAKRIQQQLSYRLGACMLANCKSLGGWVAMPWALLGEVKTFRKSAATKTTAAT